MAGSLFRLFRNREKCDCCYKAVAGLVGEREALQVELKPGDHHAM